MTRKNFSNSGLEVIQNDFYYLVINHKKGGSFRLITKSGSFSDSGIPGNFRETEVGVIKGAVFNLVNLLLGWSRLYRRILKWWLRKKVVQEGEYEKRKFEIKEREIIVRGPIGTKAAYTGNQSSRYFSLAELATKRLIPKINDSIRTFTF